jgi:hypothetical protein
MVGYGVETALLAYAGLNRRVAWWDPARWALVFREGDARVFVRRLPRYRSLIAAREIPATFAFSVEEGTATLPLSERPAGSPLADCEWQRRVGDLLFELDGATSPRAIAAYARALAAPAGCLPAEEEARLGAWLGALALGSARADDALELLDRAVARGSTDLTTLSNRALALEGLGRRLEAAAAWALRRRSCPCTGSRRTRRTGSSAPRPCAGRPTRPRAATYWARSTPGDRRCRSDGSRPEARSLRGRGRARLRRRRRTRRPAERRARAGRRCRPPRDSPASGQPAGRARRPSRHSPSRRRRPSARGPRASPPGRLRRPGASDSRAPGARTRPGPRCRGAG